MEQRRIGTTDVMLSVVGLGGAWLGHDISDATQVANAAAVINAAADAGTNWLDTSENYFNSGNEACIGAALRQVPDTFLVCTKAAPGALYSGGGSGFEPEQIRAACEGSLGRLGRDHVDTYLLHWPDETGVPLEDTWGAMSALVDDGLVRSIGLSNYERPEIARCHRQRPVDVIETGLSIIDYVEDRELVAWCGEQGIGVMVYEPLATGILTDVPVEQVRDRWADSEWAESQFFKRMFAPEAMVRAKRVVAGLAEIAAEVGASISQVAIAWVLRQPGVTSALAGSGRTDRVRDNAQAAHVELSDSTMQAIEELIPLGPAFA